MTRAGTGEQLFLAVDTSAASSVAVVGGERGILSLATGSDTMRHAEVIGSLIWSALADAGVSAAELSAVVVGMGPGPFTGLRVGIAAARTFALGAGLDVLAVVSHDAVAEAERERGTTGPLLVVTDARRREVYWSLYELVAGDSGDSGGSGSRAGVVRRIDGPGLARPDALPHARAHARVVEMAAVSAGDLGRAAFRLLATAAAIRADGAAPAAASLPAAAALGFSGAQLTAAGFATDQALYLRSPDVTMPTGVKRVTG